MKIEHIGLAVKRLSSSIPLFEKLLNTPCYKTEAVESELVNTAFFKTGESKIELVEGYSPESPIYKFIEKKFNVILANINRNILLSDIPAYSKSLDENGDLFVSGILKEDKEVISLCAFQSGLTYITEASHDNWLAIHFKKN